MNKILYSLNEFALGVIIPGRMFYNEKVSQEAEARNCSLKNIAPPLHADENDFVMGAIDGGTYLAQAGCMTYAIHSGDIRFGAVAGAMAAIRGLSAAYQRILLENVACENKEFESIRFLESIH